MKRMAFVFLIGVFFCAPSAWAIDLGQAEDSSFYYDQTSGSVIVADQANSFPPSERLQISEIRRGGQVIDLTRSFSVFPRSSTPFPFYSLGQLPGGRVAATTGTNAIATRTADGRWVFDEASVNDLQNLCAINGDSPCKGSPFFASDADSPFDALLFPDLQNPSAASRFLIYDGERKSYSKPAEWVEAEFRRQFFSDPQVLAVAADLSQIVRYESGVVTLIQKGVVTRSQAFQPSAADGSVRPQAVGQALLVLETGSDRGCSVDIGGDGQCFIDVLVWRSLPNASSFELIAQLKSSGQGTPIIDELGGLWVLRGTDLVFVDTLNAKTQVVRTCQQRLEWAAIFGPFAPGRAAGKQRWVRCDDELLNLTGFGLAIPQLTLPAATEVVLVRPAWSRDGSDQIVLAQAANVIFRYDGGVQTSETPIPASRAQPLRTNQWMERGQLCGTVFLGRPDQAKRAKVDCSNSQAGTVLWHPFEKVTESLVIGNRTFVLAADSGFLQGESSRYQLWLQEDDGDWQLLSRSSPSALYAKLFAAGDRDAGVRYLTADHVRIDRSMGQQAMTIVERDLDAQAIGRAQAVVPVIDFQGVLYHGCFDGGEFALCAYDAQGVLLGQVFASESNSLQGTLVSGNIGTFFASLQAANSWRLDVFRQGRSIPAVELFGELMPFEGKQPEFTHIAGGNIGIVYSEFLNENSTQAFLIGDKGVFTSEHKSFPFGGVQPARGATELFTQVWQVANGRWLRRDGNGGGFDQFTSAVAAVIGAEEFAAGSEIGVTAVADGFGSLRNGRLPKWFATQNGITHCRESDSIGFDGASASSAHTAGCVDLLPTPDIVTATTVSSGRATTVYAERSGRIFSSRVNGTASRGGSLSSATLEPVSPPGARLLGGFALGTSAAAPLTTVSWIQGESLVIASGQLRSVSLPVPAADVLAKYDRWLCTKAGLFVLGGDLQTPSWKHPVDVSCLSIEGQNDGSAASTIVAAMAADQSLWRCQQEACASLPLDGLNGRFPQAAGVDGSGRSVVAQGRKIFAFESKSGLGDWQDVTPQDQQGSLVRSLPKRIAEGWILTAESAIKCVAPEDDSASALRRFVLRLLQPGRRNSIIIGAANAYQ